MAREAASELPGVDVVTIPVADGGEGTVKAFVSATGAEPVTIDVTGPYSDTVVSATYAKKGYTAVIEMASTCGLTLLESLGREKNPFKTTTYGTGELILDALESGCINILLGLGAVPPMTADAVVPLRSIPGFMTKTEQSSSPWEER